MVTGPNVARGWAAGPKDIDIVCIDDLSISVLSLHVIGDEVAEEFTIDTVAGERDAYPDERLEVVFAWYLKIIYEDGVKIC